MAGSTGKQDVYKQQKQNEVTQRKNEIEQLKKKLKKVPASVSNPSGAGGGKFGTSQSSMTTNPEWAKLNQQIASLEKANKGALTGKGYQEGLEKAQKEDLNYDKEGVVNRLETDSTATVDKLRSDAQAAQDKIDQLTSDPNFDPTSPSNKALLDNLNFFVQQGDAQIKKNEELRNLYGPNYQKEIVAGRNRATADAGTLASIGARATAQQMGVGTPMTAGQQQLLAANNQQLGGQAFQQGQQYVQNLQNQALDYQKYFADRQMDTGADYRKLGLAVGKDEAKNKYGILTSNIREGRDINANIDQYGLGLRTNVAGERMNQMNQKLGAFDTEAQRKLQETVAKNNYELGRDQINFAKDQAKTDTWLGIGNLIVGGAGVAAKAYGAGKPPVPVQ